MKALSDRAKYFFSWIYNEIKGKFTKISGDLSIIDIENSRAGLGFRKPFMILFQWLVALTLAVLTMCVWGCSAPVIKYHPVNIPVKCKITVPARPVLTNNILETNMNITKYAEELEAALDACR